MITPIILKLQFIKAYYLFATNDAFSLKDANICEIHANFLGFFVPFQFFHYCAFLFLFLFLCINTWAAQLFSNCSLLNESMALPHIHCFRNIPIFLKSRFSLNFFIFTFQACPILQFKYIT